MAQLLIADGDLDHEGLLPFRGACPLCLVEVLVVGVDGVDVALEVDEVVEVFECPLCSGVAARGQARGTECYRCRDTGWVGVPLPRVGVAISEDGQGRWFAGARVEGEGVYRHHVCVTLTV